MVFFTFVATSSILSTPCWNFVSSSGLSIANFLVASSSHVSLFIAKVQTSDADLAIVDHTFHAPLTTDHATLLTAFIGAVDATYDHALPIAPVTAFHTAVSAAAFAILHQK
jgi:hypothetical protein